MKFRYFKGDKSHPVIAEICANAEKLRIQREEKLNNVLQHVPFQDGWASRGDWCCGILCRIDHEVIQQNKLDKGYNVERYDDEYYLITPNRRYKSGKALDKIMTSISMIQRDHPKLGRLLVGALGIYYRASEYITPTHRTLYTTSGGISGNHVLIMIPCSGEKEGTDFPTIPNCLTEIKHSEFLAIQGE